MTISLFVGIKLMIYGKEVETKVGQLHLISLSVYIYICVCVCVCVCVERENRDEIDLIIGHFSNVK